MTGKATVSMPFSLSSACGKSVCRKGREFARTTPSANPASVHDETPVWPATATESSGTRVERRLPAHTGRDDWGVRP